MSKKVLLFTLSVSMCLMLAACGNSAEAGNTSAPSAAPAAEATPTPEAEPTETPEAETDAPATTAPADETATPEATDESTLVDTSGMTPIPAESIADGTYAIEVSSSSSMFRIVDAQLTVADGKMSAVLTLSGTGYEKLYVGTGEEAEADSDDACIYFVEDDEGKYTYEVPVEALNTKLDVAAWSIRKQKWYDRELVFLSEQIPAEAITAE